MGNQNERVMLMIDMCPTIIKWENVGIVRGLRIILINPVLHKKTDHKESRTWACLQQWLVEVTSSKYSRYMP